MQSPVFIGSRIYRGSSYGPHHPLSIPRVPTVIDLCRAMGWLPRSRYINSPRAKPQALTSWHTPAYIEALQRAEAAGAVSPETRDRHHLGTLSNPVFAEMFRRPATAAGGSMMAANLLADGGVVYNPGGGTHHGMADRAAGFCYLNDPVLAINAFLAQGLTRIAYVDIDAHHCDGVAAAFHGDPRVLMISTHEVARLWSGVWATLTGHEIPNRLPESGRAVLAALAWSRRPVLPPDALIETLRDTPREGPVPDDLRRAIRHLRDRQSVWV